jgi:outer membrane receptor protein involved in Fe transport
MRKLACFAVILFVFVPFLSAQNYTLKGVVLDEHSQKPLFYANAGLLNAEDSTSVTGVSTDENGRFEIINVKQGNYLFQASYVGYDLYRIPLSVDGENIIIQIDTVRLTSKSRNLETFTITETKPIYMIDGEKILYNVSEDPGVQTGTASDALQNAPEVEVDIEGNITLRGVSSVEIWINDKPSKLNAENLKTYIQQLPANSIERIEVITNPSARYSSEGTGGIINIITKSNIKKNTFISFGLTGSTRPGISPWISYMWANEKFSINAYGYGNFSKSKSNSNGYNITYDDNFDTSSYRNSTTKSDNFSFNGGMFINGSYTFDTMNSLSFWANGWGYHSDGSSTTEQFYREYLSESGNYDNVNDNESNSSSYGGNIGVWYQHKFNNEGHNFSVNLGGNFNGNSSHSQYDRIYSNLLNKDIHQKSESNGNSLGASLSFNYNIPYSKKGEISAGVSGGYSQGPGLNRTDTLLLNSEIYHLDSMRFRDNFSRSGNFSAYTTIQQKIGNFTIKAGLRVEYKHFEYEYLNSPKDNVEKDYWGFFPSLHLSYRTKSMHNFNASYTRRVNFPYSSQLSTFITYNLDSYSTGNPDLLPTYTNSVDAGWTKYFDKFGSVGLSAYYRNSKDEIGSLTDVNYMDYYGRIVSFSMPVNSGHSYQYGASANMMYRLKSFMNLRLNASVYHSYSETQFREEDDPVQTKNTNFSLRLNFWAKLWKVLEVHASGNYRSKTKSLFNETKPTYSINAGLRADFLKRKISVYVNVQDIFNWNKREYNTTNPYYESYSSTKYTSRYISAGITFRFGKIEMESQAKTGAGLMNGE